MFLIRVTQGSRTPDPWVLSVSSIATLPVTPVTSQGVSCRSSIASGSAPKATDAAREAADRVEQSAASA